MYMKSLDSFILASRDQTLACLRLYGDSRVSRINAYEILLQHDWLLFFNAFFASCFEINVFYLTNLDKSFFLNNKKIPLLLTTHLIFYL